MPANGFIGLSEGDPNGATIAGFVLSSNKTVDLTMADGTTESVPVAGNLLFAHTTAPGGFASMQTDGIFGSPVDTNLVAQVPRAGEYPPGK
jgi:hypothetical protein